MDGGFGQKLMKINQMEERLRLKASDGPEDQADEGGGCQAQGDGAPENPAFFAQGAAHGSGNGDLEG